MKKTLAIATLALGLFAFGCDDDDPLPPAPGDAAKPDAGDAGTTSDAPADAPKPDTVTATDTGGDVADAGAGDSGSDTAAAISWTNCVEPKDNVPALAFCTQYMLACAFDPTGGAANAERYKSMAECMTAYDASSVAKKGCTAYHLCVASGSVGAGTTHCPHPPQASLTPNVGPCANK